MPDNEKFIEGVGKAKIQKRIDQYEEIFNTANIDKNSDIYIKAKDVIEELVSLLKKSNSELTFIEMSEIEKKIKFYEEALKSLDKELLEKQKEELEKKHSEEIEKLKEARENNDEVAPEVDKQYIDKVTEDLKAQIANREAMLVAREGTPEQYKQLKSWTQELSDLENGKISARLLKIATDLEIKDLTEKIANRENVLNASNSIPTQDKILLDLQKKMDALKNPQNAPKQDNSKKIQENIELLEKQLKDVNTAITSLDSRDDEDIELQKRISENCLNEYKEIAKEKELFKIDEKGEVTIDYPEVSYQIDMEAVKEEYEIRRIDMLDKFYGNKNKAKMYAEAMKELQEHVVEKEFEFVDEDGNTKTGTYQTVEQYIGKSSDLKFMQLEEYGERLERLSKFVAGDESVYENVYVRDEKGRMVKADPDKTLDEDIQYIETNNNAYNRLISTRDNLKTLGKYGEKVEYTKFQQGQPIRNIVRAVGNAAKFARNHVTAPINKFIGSKIVSPIYASITGADSNVAGLYSNKLSHRYVARREYFEAQGKGYFSSRFNSIFNAKEANKAILSAGAYDIQQSLLKKYTEMAQKEVFEKRAEFASKSIDEKIKMIKEDMEKAKDDKDKAKFQATLENLEKAKVQIERDKEANARTSASQVAQTDAIDFRQHDIANKENVTRTITGVKAVSRLGFRKLVGPKIKDWLLAHTKKTEKLTVIPSQEKLEEVLGIKDKEWVPTTYKQEEMAIGDTVKLNTNASMSEIMSSNAGKQIEGYYSVYGGEVKPVMYDVKGSEKITAIFEKVGNAGKGLSDAEGLQAPTLTDGTFARELLDSDGILKQDITLEQILATVGNDSKKLEELSNVYVTVDDTYWAKLSDLCAGLTEKVAGSPEMKEVVDIIGHYKEISPSEKAKMIEKALEEYNKNPMTHPELKALLETDKTAVVENTRVVNALKTLGKALNIADGALIAEDIYENTRKTDSEIETQKPEERKYDFKAGFTGDKKEDQRRFKGIEDEGR